MEKVDGEPQPHGELLHEGALFHRFKRYATAPDGRVIDRLEEVLRHGLLAPAHDRNGTVVRDFSIEVSGSGTEYDSVVFIHRYDPAISHLYCMVHGAEDVFVFIDRETPIATPEDMDGGWPILCQDEVYSLEPIPPERITAVMVQDAEVGGVSEQMRALLEEGSVALYGTSGRRFV